MAHCEADGGGEKGHHSVLEELVFEDVSIRLSRWSDCESRGSIAEHLAQSALRGLVAHARNTDSSAQQPVGDFDEPRTVLFDVANEVVIAVEVGISVQDVGLRDLYIIEPVIDSIA